MEQLAVETIEKLAAKLESMAQRHAELEQKLSDPSVIADSAVYSEIGKEYGSLARFAEMAAQLSEARRRRREAREILEDPEMDDEEMRELAEDESAAAAEQEQRVAARALDLLSEDPADAKRNVILEIRGGTGGEEAALFAADLLRMYQHYCQRRGWKMELLDSSPTDMGGLREVSVSINGSGAWHKLRHESGGHRVQRVPTTESQGRIHTSLATVAVMPEAEDVEVELNPDEIEVSFMRSSGPGGQNVNKVSSCVRLVHKPTGITVKCQEDKSQHKNRRLAEKLLRTRLYDEQLRQAKEERDSLRRNQVGSGSRNERVRTYNFPQDRITDHRIGLDVFGIESVLMGDCDKIFDALAEWDKRRQIEELIAGD